MKRYYIEKYRTNFHLILTDSRTKDNLLLLIIRKLVDKDLKLPNEYENPPALITISNVSCSDDSISYGEHEADNYVYGHRFIIFITFILVQCICSDLIEHPTKKNGNHLIIWMTVLIITNCLTRYYSIVTCFWVFILFCESNVILL